jgi:hypothetical protein
MHLTVVLGASNEASFNIVLNDNSFVRKWVKELSWCLNNCEINQQEAFAGLLTPTESKKILDKSCSIINEYLAGFIDIQEDCTQEYLNYLHLKFEALSGKFGKPTKLFATANSELKAAIRDLNFFLHRLEHKLLSVNELYLSFNKDQYRRFPLDEEDYQLFELDTVPGTLYLHYVELGKEYFDLFQDGLDLDYPAFANLHYYSGEASLTFDELNFTKNQQYLDWAKQHNIDPTVTRPGDGRIPLGTADTDALELIKKYRHISRIDIHE